MATKYKVGGSAGWTLKTPVNFYQWASSKAFLVDDILVFWYNSTHHHHNVMEVTQKNFMQCKSDNPIKTYVNGSDKILLKRPGYYFFIDGVASHCQAGLKFSINVGSRPGQSYPSEDEKPSKKETAAVKKAKAPRPSKAMPPYYNPKAQAPWTLKAAPIPAPGPMN